MTDAEWPKQVLFICVENCNRSQRAEEFARMIGAGWVEGYSAGCRLLGRVHPKAVKAMRELGYDLTAHQSKSLADLPDVEFDVAVTMGCGEKSLPIRSRVREDWNVPCPKEMPMQEFRAVRDLIGEKVKALLERPFSDLVH